MCLATPMQITKMEGKTGFVEHDGKEYKVDLFLLDTPKVGDWIMAHGELAVNKISSEEAKTILELIERSSTTA